MSIFLLTTIFSVFSSAEKNDDKNINLSYIFEKPSIKQIMIENELYDEVTLKDISCFGNPGEPYLPVKGAYILLPQNTIVDKIIVESENTKSIEFYIDEEKVFTDDTPPFSLDLECSKGLHILEVRGFNNNYISLDIIDFYKF